MPDISKDAFSGIAGHAPVLKLLRSQLASGRLAHVYLFVGEPAVGKTAVATRLATALLPEAPLERHPDYWEDDRRDNLRIGEVRLRPNRQPEHHQHSLQALLSLKAAIGTYRVALFSNVGRLADHLQGILVKTLEEPHPPGDRPDHAQRVPLRGAADGGLALPADQLPRGSTDRGGRPCGARAFPRTGRSSLPASGADDLFDGLPNGPTSLPVGLPRTAERVDRSTSGLGGRPRTPRRT